MTSYITSVVNLSGTTPFEGGAVIKYAAGRVLLHLPKTTRNYPLRPVRCHRVSFGTPERPAQTGAPQDSRGGGERSLLLA